MTPNLFIGSVCIRLERVDSSNNYARELIRDKMPIEGTVIVANEQTSGRGQRANTWFSEPKSNLTCSYILRPVFLAAKNQFVLSAAVALAVFETVYQFIPNNTLRIKWPNDILVGDKKIAGILIENTL
ncbi:MAG: BirA family biotin operon repressor/biotin-[acetyl-CoA-carboxylase] ligase, partial [Alteromonas macleodii]